MKRIRIRICPRSAFGTAMMSDTLWGQVCLSIAEMWGRERLTEMLQSVTLPLSDVAGEAGDGSSITSKTAGSVPFAVFSDAFLADTLPVPCLRPISIASSEYDDLKAIKKQRWLEAKALLEIRQRFRPEDVAKALLREAKKGQCREGAPVGDVKRARGAGDGRRGQRQHSRIRNSINRQTGKVLEGALFPSQELFYEGGLDIYALLDEQSVQVDELKEVLSYIGQTGYGRDTSVGLGQFGVEWHEEDPQALAPLHEANAFMSLSHGIPAHDCRLHHGTTLTKFGRHGGKWAVRGNPLKNPVVLYEPGSTFQITQQADTYGRVLAGVSQNPGTHLHAAWLLPMFLHLEES